MDLHIHKLTPEHAKDVQRLSGQLGYPMSLPDIETNIVDVMNRKDHVAFVALQDGKVVGWVHAFRGLLLESQPFIEIGGLVVDEDHRGRGVGKELVRKIIAWCSEKGFGTLRVRSNIKRKEAHRFYLELGFSEIKDQKVFQMQL